MNQQLRLLPAPKPLTERFGAAFFRGSPRVPGVYRMFDEAGLLLYVGQSSDLRDRLNSYAMCIRTGLPLLGRMEPAEA